MDVLRRHAETNAVTIKIVGYPKDVFSRMNDPADTVGFASDGAEYGYCATLGARDPAGIRFEDASATDSDVSTKVSVRHTLYTASMRHSFQVLLLCTSALFACASPTPEDDSASSEAAQTGREASLEFLQNEVRADVLRTDDGSIVVAYDTRRLTTCGLITQAGLPNTAMELSYRLNGGAIQNVPLAEHWFGDAKSTVSRAVLPAQPHVGTLEIWFHTWNREGCDGWDSSGGQNYRFAVQSPATTGTLEFTGPKGHVTASELKAGGFAKVIYDQQRVPGCAQNLGGEGEHWITMWNRFDFQGDFVSQTVNSFQGGFFQPIALPTGAHHLELWFEASGSNGCHDYDSHDGQNYVFGLH